MARTAARGLERYFGQRERVLLETRQHPVAVLSAFVDALGLLVPLALVVWGASGVALLRGRLVTWIVTVCFVAMVLVVLRLAAAVVRWEYARLLVTTEKVVYVHGILHRRIASTPLVKVSELTVSQPLLGRMLGFGSLVVDAPGGGEQPLHGLAYIPDPFDVYRLIHDTARAERTLEGGGNIDVYDVPMSDFYPGSQDDDDEGPTDTFVIRRPPRG